MTALSDLHALPTLVEELGLTLDRIEITGQLDTWRGPFAVDDIAVSCVVAATAAARELLTERNNAPSRAVHIDARHAAASFLSDALAEPVGWQLPPIWDPIAGDYRTRDGWIRLHTNYRHHRNAALIALDADPAQDIDKATVADLVARWSGEDLESAVIAHNGVAGQQRTEQDWMLHVAGRAIAKEPLLAVEYHTAEGNAAIATRLSPAVRPFDGVRVLDLTRVLAGPTATGFLAAWGADVLRIDPPGFEEVPAIVPITTCAKHTTTIDFRSPRGREQFVDLLRTADVVVHGYRPDALAGLGLDPKKWNNIRPGLVVASLDAYGWHGPWSSRRGFDSIVQHSTGITAIAQQAMGSERPVPLPCQALDHGCGWLLAAAVAKGLTERCRTGRGTTAKTSLARFSNFVCSLPTDIDPHRPQPTLSDVAQFLATATTAWGPLRRLTWPATIGGIRPILGTSHPIGTHKPQWSHAG